MKRQFLAFVMAILFSLGVNAQDYNKWSIDAGAGVSILSSSGLSEGYNTPFPNLWTMNGGIRYMFNNKFGVRVGGGFDQLNQAGNSPKFATRIWNVNVQGVANLGRVLAFEEFTKNIGLLGHVGVGYGYMTSKNFRGVDNLGIITFGLTPQVRLSDRVTLLLSGTFNWYLTQQYTFNGENLTKDVNMTPMRHVNFQGLNFTAAAGLQIALGKKRVHADWYGIKREDKDDDKKVAQNEKTVNNHITRGGSDVAANGQRIENDKNALANNNVNNANDSDDEGDVNNSNIASNQNTTTNNIIVESVDPAKELIEKGYVNAYFGFDSSEPQDGSLWAVGFVANYLKQNPDAKLNIIGYTDQVGNAGYNEKLSKKRADAVKQLLVEMGVDTSRLVSEGKGIDKGAKSRDKGTKAKSAGARRLVRRVSFELTNESGNKDSHIASK